MRKKLPIRVYVTEEIKEYLEIQSEEYGMSLSAYINMCISQVRQQNETVKYMNNMQDLMYQIKELEMKGALVSKGFKVKALGE